MNYLSILLDIARWASPKALSHVSFELGFKTSKYATIFTNY